VKRLIISSFFIFLTPLVAFGKDLSLKVPTRNDWRIQRALFLSGMGLPKPILFASSQQDIEEEIPLEPEEEEVELKISDPLEPLNRVIFTFNDHVYRFILKPIVRVYKLIMPAEFRMLIKNFFTNLAMPVRFVNCVLQGKIKAAARELLRFVLNTTIGVLGLVDVATEWGIKSQPEDLGQTLAVYGVGEGPYLVLPLLGPTTLRDGVGTALDMFLEPVNYMPKNETFYGVKALNYTNKSSYYLETYFDLKASALDPYVAVRNAYVQHRRQEVKQ